MDMTAYDASVLYRESMRRLSAVTRTFNIPPGWTIHYADRSISVRHVKRKLAVKVDVHKNVFVDYTMRGQIKSRIIKCGSDRESLISMINWIKELSGYEVFESKSGEEARAS